MSIDSQHQQVIDFHVGPVNDPMFDGDDLTRMVQEITEKVNGQTFSVGKMEEVKMYHPLMWTAHTHDEEDEVTHEHTEHWHMNVVVVPRGVFN